MPSFRGLLRRVADRLNPPTQATDGPAILMYHRIADDSFDPWGLAVSRSNFVEHVGWLVANRSILSLVDFAQLHRQARLPKDAVAITFDDGYASVIEEAAPVLADAGASATIFIPADLVERGGVFWWDELKCIVLETPLNSLEFEGSVVLGEQMPADDRWLPDHSPQTPRQIAFYALWERLKPRAPAAIDKAMADLREQAGVSTSENCPRLLTADELRRRPALLDVGSHALTHPSLPRLSFDEKAREIRESVARCEALSGAPPRTFAFPFGDNDRDSLVLVRNAGFECACTTEATFVTARTDPFRMPRLAVPNCDAAGLASRLGAS